MDSGAPRASLARPKPDAERDTSYGRPNTDPTHSVKNSIGLCQSLTVRLPDLKAALVQDCDHANGHDYDRCDVFFPQLAAVRSS